MVSNRAYVDETQWGVTAMSWWSGCLNSWARRAMYYWNCWRSLPAIPISSWRRRTPAQSLPTVRSRAQVFQLPPVDEGVLADYLCRQFSMERDRAMGMLSSRHQMWLPASIGLLNRVSDGWIWENDVSESIYWRSNGISWVEWTIDRPKPGRTEAVLLFVERLLSLSLRTRHGLLTVREGVEVLEYAAKISGRMDAQTIDNMQIMITDTIYAIQRNANIRILLLDFMIKLSGLIRGGLI